MWNIDSLPYMPVFCQLVNFCHLISFGIPQGVGVWLEQNKCSLEAHWEAEPGMGKVNVKNLWVSHTPFLAKVDQAPHLSPSSRLSSCFDEEKCGPWEERLHRSWCKCWEGIYLLSWTLCGQPRAHILYIISVEQHCRQGSSCTLYTWKKLRLTLGFLHYAPAIWLNHY